METFLMPTKMPTEELARRFGAKLRGRASDIMEQTLPVAMTQLLFAIATLEQQQSDDAEVGSPDRAPGT